jgi:predicted AAA+ superfamily ATPase
LEQSFTRDALTLEAGRDPERLSRYFEAYALHSAGVVEHKAVYSAAGINRRTADAYQQLLTNLFIVQDVPAWASNRLKRLVRSPKRQLLDASLLAASLRIDAASLLRDGNLLGRVLDLFVTSQLRAQLDIAETKARLYHLRQEAGRHEVDVILELAGGGIIGLEVKATSAPSRGDAQHLSWLRDELGETFVRGVVLHTGPRTFSLGERIDAVPISALWTP